jgi:hypothetical protein
VAYALQMTQKNRKNRNNCAGRADHPPNSSISFIATEGAFKAAFILQLVPKEWKCNRIKKKNLFLFLLAALSKN